MLTYQSLCEGKGVLAADEKLGILHMKLQGGSYQQSIKLKIPPMYPEEGVLIEFTTSTFPKDMQYMFRSQAEEVYLRLFNLVALFIFSCSDKFHSFCFSCIDVF
jgi:hypothetical protein